MVLDVVGASWTSENLRILKREGRIFMIGMRKGKYSDIVLGPVCTKQCSIQREPLSAFSAPPYFLAVRLDYMENEDEVKETKKKN